MTDETTEPTETETASSAQAPEQYPEDHPLVKALAAQKEQIRELKERNTTAAEKARQFDALEEAKKTELEKAQAKIAELERSTAEVIAAKLRSDIAREKGVPIELLTGSDEETLTAQADRVLAFKGTPPATPSSDGQGKQGESVSGQVKQLSREDLKSMTPSQIEAAHDAGQLNAMQGISN